LHPSVKAQAFNQLTDVTMNLSLGNQAIFTFGQVESKDGENSVLLKQLAALQAKRFMKLLAVVQDLADTVLAMNDIRGARLLVLLPI